MNRIARSAFTMFLTLSVVTAYAWFRYGSAAAELGSENRFYSTIVNKRTAWTPKEPWLAWLGDSTMRPRPDLGLASYPFEVGLRVGRRGISNWEITLPGLDPFHYYYLLGSVLDMRPNALVLAATLRTLHGPSPGMERNYLCSFMTPQLAVRATTLPFYAHGMTIPDILFCPLLAKPAMQQSVVFLDGLRRLFSEAAFWGAADYPRERPKYRDVAQIVAKNLRTTYGPSVTASTPAVAVLEAVVETATSHGIPTLVILSAVPVELLAEHDLYDAELLTQRVEVIRTVVEQAGGQFLDLHDKIPTTEMRDQSGHLNGEGIEHVSDLVEPIVLEMLRSFAVPDGSAP